MRAYAIAFALLVSLAGACCGGDQTATSPSTVTSPTEVTWQNLIGPGGSASRTFTATQAGTVTLTLVDATIPLGIGVGVSAGGTCRLAASELATPGDSSDLSVAVEAGSYCVLIFDVLATVEQVTFTARLVYP